MKSYCALSWKEIKTQKITSILILVAITLSTLMTTVVGQSVGMLKNMRIHQAEMLSGTQYATFIQLDDKELNILRKDSRFSFIGEYINLGSVELEKNITLMLLEPSENYLNMNSSLKSLIKGRMPETYDEIALPEDSLKYLNFEGKIGDKISLKLSRVLRQDYGLPYEYEREFTLTGILKSNYLGYSSGNISGICGKDTADVCLPEKYHVYNVGIQTADKNEFNDLINGYKAKFDMEDINIAYNDIYLQAKGIEYNSHNPLENKAAGISFVMISGCLIATLVLIAAGLVIYNVLKISTIQRVKEYGTLRAIGAQKKHIYAIVILQLLILCGIGIPLGTIIGNVTTKGVVQIITSFISTDNFMISSTEELSELINNNVGINFTVLVSSITITVCFSLLATIPVAAYVAKISPTTAMHGKNIKVKRKKKKNIRNFERFYAWLNMSRNKGRAIITVLSLVMSISVFIALQGITSLLDVGSNMKENHLGDYALTSETIGFSTDVIKQLQGYSEIQDLLWCSLDKYETDENGNLINNQIGLELQLQPGENFQVAGLNSNYIDKFFENTLTLQQIEMFKSGKGCIVRNPLPIEYEGVTYPTTKILQGSTFIVGNQELDVIDTLDGYEGDIRIGNQGFERGVQLIVSDSVYTEITGKDTINEIYPELVLNADREKTDIFIENLIDATADAYYISYEDTDRQIDQSFKQTEMLAWGIIILVGLIGVLNIINTVYTNIHTRINEIGLQRAIGMSRSKLYKMFLWEGGFYGIISTIFGTVVGYICLLFINAAQTNTFEITSLPIVSILEVAAIAISVCLIATIIPLRSIAKMQIVESIDFIE